MALSGAYEAKKKDGTVYYRASVTFRSKHISLGSYPTKQEAHLSYLQAKSLFDSDIRYEPDDYSIKQFPSIDFCKWISLINFKNNGYYIKTPIYLKSNYFYYYLSQKDVLLFDADDLFYYSKHSIMRRGNHLFVAEYGMQTNIHSRYGIKNFARLNVDYRFVNGDSNDFRYSNIEIRNAYHGVTMLEAKKAYSAKIHIHGNYTIGTFQTPTEAAIAYNKAADFLKEIHCPKKFEKNYLEDLSKEEYLSIYQRIALPKKIRELTY